MEPSQIAERVTAKFPSEVVGTEEYGGQVSLILRKDGMRGVFEYLRDDPELSMDFLKDLCGVDHHGKRDMRFQVVYHLYSIRHAHSLRVKVNVSEDDCSVDSVVPLWRGADWPERECYDLYGISFAGHPDLRRILMPDEWEGHPLRKDYPLKGPETEWEGFEEVRKKAEELRKYEWNR